MSQKGPRGRRVERRQRFNWWWLLLLFPIGLGVSRILPGNKPTASDPTATAVFQHGQPVAAPDPSDPRRQGEIITLKVDVDGNQPSMFGGSLPAGTCPGGEIVYAMLLQRNEHGQIIFNDILKNRWTPVQVNSIIGMALVPCGPNAAAEMGEVLEVRQQAGEVVVKRYYQPLIHK